MVNEKMADLFGKNLRELRLQNHMTIEELAEKLDVSTRMIYNWETGLNLPSVVRLVEMSYMFGVTMDSILLNR